MSLNDPKWGRGGSNGGSNDDGKEEPRREQESRPQRPQRPSEGPPDLDELWRDFNRRLSGLFGRKGGRRGGTGGNGGRFGGFTPDGKGAGLGLAAVLAVIALIWLGSGFYIVPEGQVGVVTTFGKASDQTTAPGFRWRLPWPIQNNELVDISSLRRVEVGTRGRPERLKEALMLSDDENIVDIQFEVQYRIKDTGARDYLFNSRNPTAAVIQSAESAMREVVGRKTMDSVLYESRQEIAVEVRRMMQDMLDRYGTGILVQAVAIQNAQPPEQVQAAFDDAVKAGQDREREINLGQAYANDVIPKARGLSARLLQEADGYRSRVIETAQGDASRFQQVLVEYNKAPEVTRDRLYIDTMQQVFSNTSKVMVDVRNSSPLLYLPFDKLMQQALQDSGVARPAPTTAPEAAPVPDTRARKSAHARSRRTVGVREPMNRIVAVVIGLVLVAVAVRASTFIVDQRQFAIVFQLGEIVRVVTQPGLYFKMPLLQNVEYQDSRILTIDTPQADRVQTSEKKNLLIDSFVRWRISEPRAFRVSFPGGERSAEERISTLVRDALNQAVNKRTVNEITSRQREKAMEEIRVAVQESVKGLGVEIVDVRLKRVDFVPEISDSVYGRMQAERKRVANEQRSIGSAEGEKIRADADRQREVLLAEAYSAAQKVKGEGDAKASAMYAQAFGQNPDFAEFYRTLEAYRTTFKNRNDLMVIDPSSEFFKYLRTSKPGSAGANTKGGSR